VSLGLSIDDLVTWDLPFMGRSENGAVIGREVVGSNRKPAIVLMGRMKAGAAAGTAGPSFAAPETASEKISAGGGRIFLLAIHATAHAAGRVVRENATISLVSAVCGRLSRHSRENLHRGTPIAGVRLPGRRTGERAARA
jgi:hypothetical protein